MIGLKVSSDTFTRSSTNSTFMVAFSTFLVSGSLASIIFSRYFFLIMSMKEGGGIFCILHAVSIKQPEKKRTKA